MAGSNGGQQQTAVINSSGTAFEPRTAAVDGYQPRADGGRQQEQRLCLTLNVSSRLGRGDRVATSSSSRRLAVVAARSPASCEGKGGGGIVARRPYQQRLNRQQQPRLTAVLQCEREKRNGEAGGFNCTVTVTTLRSVRWRSCELG